MPRRNSGAVRKCSHCYIDLPITRAIYAELRGGWAVAHETGGVHNVRYPDFTGVVLCALDFKAQRPKPWRPALPALCTDCQQAPVRFRQLVYAWTQLPATKAVHDARYGSFHLCEQCWLKRQEGEQLALFDG